jgi:hypothetical protein
MSQSLSLFVTALLAGGASASYHGGLSGSYGAGGARMG